MNKRRCEFEENTQKKSKNKPEFYREFYRFNVKFFGSDLTEFKPNLCDIIVNENYRILLSESRFKR